MIDIFADEKTLDVSNGTISVGHFYKNRLGNALWCRATWCKFLLNTAQLSHNTQNISIVVHKDAMITRLQDYPSKDFAMREHISHKHVNGLSLIQMLYSRTRVQSLQRPVP